MKRAAAKTVKRAKKVDAARPERAAAKTTAKAVSRAAARIPKGDGELFRARSKKRIPFELVLDELAAIDPETKPMFGCLAVYAGDKIVMILRDRPSHPHDNGVWIATTVAHHASLSRDFPDLRSITVLGGGVTGWQLLPADAPDFEEDVRRACGLVLRGDPRIGTVPASRRAR